MEQPAVFKSSAGDNVIVNQVGWAGFIPGRLVFESTKFLSKKMIKTGTISVSQKTGI